MPFKTDNLIVQIVVLHCPIFIPLIAIFFKRIRNKWKNLIYGVSFQVFATSAIYIFTWYCKFAGYKDYYWGWWMYYPVNILSIIIYLIIIIYIIKKTRIKEMLRGRP